jgi:prolyl-tRNA synthetase
MQSESVFAAPRIALPAPGSTEIPPKVQKLALPLVGLADAVAERLDTFHRTLYQAAVARRAAMTHEVATYTEFKARIEGGGFFRVYWHDDATAEATIKEETRATIRCYPLEGQDAAAGQVCFYSGRPATHVALFARAY